MKKIVNKRFKETYYHELLPNGLNVIIWEKKGFVSSSAIFATPYGALDYKQRCNGEVFEVKSGAAHFLEHKLFEDEEKDIMALFSAMGANVNAFTSYNETMYYFTSGSEDIRKPLELLLDFVQELKINEKSVEKEKGIITQELLMYKQMPDVRLFSELFSAIYRDFPLKDDIGGTVESVKAMTLNELYDCYRRNYHPTNMYLIVVSGQDPEELMETIRTNQSSKQFGPYAKMERSVYNEPLICAKDRAEIVMDVANKKVGLAFKLQTSFDTDRQRVKAEWAMKFLLEAYFTPLTKRYQQWLDSGRITDYFGYDVDLAKDYALLVFFNECENADEFKDWIIEEIRSIDGSYVSESLLSQFKKRYFGQSLNYLNNIDHIGVSYARSLFNGVNFFDSIELINEIDLHDIERAYRLICCDAATLVELYKG